MLKRRGGAETGRLCPGRGNRRNRRSRRKLSDQETQGKFYRF